MRKIVKDKAYWENQKEKRRKYYQENKEKLKEASNKRYYENIEVIAAKSKAVRSTPEFKAWQKEYDKQYREKHREKRRSQNRESERRRTLNDPAFKIRRRLRNSIYCALMRNHSTKNNISILQFLPYSMSDLKIHLESLFEPWMNWNNWGIYDPKTWIDDDSSTWKWQLDHITHHYLFKYSSMEDAEFQKCWALENLRPYSAKQNCLENTHEKRIDK